VSHLPRLLVLLVAGACGGPAPAVPPKLPLISNTAPPDAAPADSRQLGGTSAIEHDALVAFFGDRFPNAAVAGTLELDDSDTSTVIEELAAMHILTLDELAAIIPGDYEARAFPLETTNVTGTVRNLLMVHDVRRYVADAYESGWVGSGDDFAVAAAYGTDLQGLVDAGIMPAP